MFCSDYPRWVVSYLWFRWLAASSPLPVASALAVAFLLARRRRPISLLCLPPRPFPRRLPASLAAVALARLPGTKALLASLYQTGAAHAAGEAIASADALDFRNDL